MPTGAHHAARSCFFDNDPARCLVPRSARYRLAAAGNRRARSDIRLPACHRLALQAGADASGSVGRRGLEWRRWRCGEYERSIGGVFLLAGSNSTREVRSGVMAYFSFATLLMSYLTGIWAGSHLFQGVSDRFFRYVVLVLVAAMGIVALVW